MTPYKQLFHHKPDEGIYGDCARTALGCLLDLPPKEVPHQHAYLADGEQRRLFDEWLKPRGLAIAFFAFNCEPADIMAAMKVSNPGMYYMLSGTSRTGCNHVVICLDDHIVHDPSLTDAGIVGACDDGCTYIEFLVPIALKVAA